MLLVLLLGMIPPFLLIIYIYHLDKIEKEPIGLLVRLFLFGGLCTIPACLLEEIGIRILDLFPLREDSAAYLAIEMFLIVGLAEEGCKHFVLEKSTWYDSNFNYRFDAVIYSVCVSLGFAAFENVMYILDLGFGVAPIRAVTAIPMHCITGIFMGHYYGEAKFAEGRHNWERMDVFKAMSLIIPILLHGFYDFAASSEDSLLTLLFIAYVVIVDIIAFFSVRRYSREDAPIW